MIFARPLAAPAALIAALAFLLAACGDILNPPPRLGMVKDPGSGLQFGSVVERSLVTDPSFYENSRIKVRTRNTSGDTAFDLRQFAGEIERAYQAAGYLPTAGDDFGLLVDVNVLYSGQAQTNLSQEFAFLGAGAGAAAGGFGAGSLGGAAIGTASGATLGAILGSFTTNDTYVIVAQVTFGVVRGQAKRDGKTITFSRSITGHPEDWDDEQERRSARGFRSTDATKVSVFAGGRNTPQQAIAGEVRRRLVRIVGDII